MSATTCSTCSPRDRSGRSSYGDVATLAGVIGIIILPLGGAQVFVARHVAGQGAHGRALNDGNYVTGFGGAMLLAGCALTVLLLAASPLIENMAFDRKPARGRAGHARDAAVVRHAGDDRRGAGTPPLHAGRRRAVRACRDPRRLDGQRASRPGLGRQRDDGGNARRGGDRRRDPIHRATRQPSRLVAATASAA